MIEIDPPVFQERCNFRERALVAVDRVCAAIVLVRRSRHHEAGIWDDSVGVWSGLLMTMSEGPRRRKTWHVQDLQSP